PHIHERTTHSALHYAHPNYENEQHNMPVEKKFDWGLCGGPGIELRTGIGSFLLEGRYYYALSDIFNSRKEDYFSKSSSQVISAKIGRAHDRTSVTIINRMTS